LANNRIEPNNWTEPTSNRSKRRSEREKGEENQKVLVALLKVFLKLRQKETLEDIERFFQECGTSEFKGFSMLDAWYQMRDEVNMMFDLGLNEDFLG